MFYCMADSHEFDIRFVTRCLFGVIIHTIILCTVAVMLQYPIERCGLVVYQSHTKTFRKIFEQFLRSATTIRINT